MCEYLTHEDRKEQKLDIVTECKERGPEAGFTIRNTGSKTA